MISSKGSTARRLVRLVGAGADDAFQKVSTELPKGAEEPLGVHHGCGCPPPDATRLHGYPPLARGQEIVLPRFS